MRGLLHVWPNDILSVLWFGVFSVVGIRASDLLQRDKLLQWQMQQMVRYVHNYFYSRCIPFYGDSGNICNLRVLQS